MTAEDGVREIGQYGPAPHLLRTHSTSAVHIIVVHREAKRTDQTKADSGQTRGQAASRHRSPPLATKPAAHESTPTIDQHQARRRPAQFASPPATAGSAPDVTHPTPRICTAPLPCPAAAPRHIRLSLPAFSPRQIPPGGHHRVAGESLSIRAGSTQLTRALRVTEFSLIRPRWAGGHKWLCSRWQKSAYDDTNKRCGGTRERRNPNQSRQKCQIHRSACNSHMKNNTRYSRRRTTRVTSERTSRDGSASGKRELKKPKRPKREWAAAELPGGIPSVRRKSDKSVIATSVGGTSGGSMAKAKYRSEMQHAQKRLRHKCCAYNCRMNNGAKRKKEIEGIKWMGVSCVLPLQGNADRIIKLSLPSISRK